MNVMFFNIKAKILKYYNSCHNMNSGTDFCDLFPLFQRVINIITFKVDSCC